jgi:hypothetical protein
MVQGYYTLQEAAEFLDVSPDELKQMAQRKEVRSFQDRGSLRFRIQDVQELGRRRGTASDPDLVIGEAQPATPRVGPRSPSSPRPPSKKEVAPAEDDVFDFSLQSDEGVGVGKEILADIQGGSKKSGPKPPSPPQGRKSAAHSPQPHPGSSSDVKLVTEGAYAGSGSDVKLIGQDSDVKLTEPVTKTPKVAKKSAVASGSPSPKKSSGLGAPQPDSGPKKHSPRTPSAAQPADSGVRLVPMDSDSDVKIVGAGSDEVPLGASPPMSSSDSDVRLEKHHQSTPDSGEGEMVLTEEINLDEEIRMREAALQQPPGKLKPKSKVKFPTTSPFELSEPDMDKPSATRPKSGSKPKSDPKKQSPADSSDFDLTPAGDPSGSALLQPDSSADFSLGLSDESALGGEQSGLTGPSSGISLNNPVDAGISLEEGSPEASDVDFDLSLEVEATPKPARGPEDSDSEFELSLDADDSGTQAIAPSPMDSDSEFELTLDDSGGLAPMEAEDSHAPQLKADSGEKDIFETDFEVPALDDDSGSQVAALDTDLDSSDFDIALDDSAVEDESASQVVALDEEADESGATRAEEGGVEVEEEGGFGGLEVAGDEEDAVAEADVDDAKTILKDRLIQPAPWGALPVVFMLPCVIVMVLVGLLGFELVQSVGGYKSPGFLTKAVGEMIGQKIK